MGNLVRKEQCPQCADQGQDRSGDNLAVYEDGSVHCFACNYNTGKSWSVKGVYRDIQSRGLERAACEKIGVQCGKYTGRLGKAGHVTDRKVIVQNRYNKDGTLNSQKIRDVTNRGECCTLGDTKCNFLQGMHSFHPNEKRFLVVTEGELDAVAVYQATQFPVVSLTKGCQGAARQLSENLEWLSKWRYVVLLFDNDDPGKDAAAECLDLFEPGGVRIATTPLKDANDMVMAGRGQELKEIIWSAADIGEEGLVSPADLIAKALEPIEVGPDWPWPTMTKMFFGIRPADFIIIAGGSGIGKTQVVTEIITHCMINTDTNIALFSAEQKAEETLQHVVSGMLGVKYYVPGVLISEEDQKRFVDAAMGITNRLSIFNEDGAFKWERIRNKISYQVKAKGTNLVIIDNLKAIEAGIKGNKTDGVADIMADIKGLANRLEVTVVLMCHLAKDKGMVSAAEADSKKSWRRGRIPLLENVFGTSSVEAWCSGALGLSRDAIGGSKIIRTECLKLRPPSGLDGAVFNLHYDASGRLTERPEVI